MIDGVINNGSKEKEAQKEKKPSLLERLEEKKAEVDQAKQAVQPTQRNLADKDL